MGLNVVATPIGNLEDLSPRAREVLLRCSTWLVEDTRVSGRLRVHLETAATMRRMDEHTTDQALLQYVRLAESEEVAVLTDAGTPGVSDPGARLVDLCREHDVTVEAVPGPSAVTLALSLSGFFAQRFAFLGFLGRKPGDIRKELAPFADSPFTLVLFESPLRLDRLLVTAHEALGERRYAICRELTKLHEQIYRSSLPLVPSESEVPRKGEVTLVIEGRRKAKQGEV